MLLFNTAWKAALQTARQQCASYTGGTAVYDDVYVEPDSICEYMYATRCTATADESCNTSGHDKLRVLGKTS